MKAKHYLVSSGDYSEWYKYESENAEEAVKLYMSGEAIDFDAEYKVVGPIEPTVFKVGPYDVGASK